MFKEVAKIIGYVSLLCSLILFTSPYTHISLKFMANASSFRLYSEAIFWLIVGLVLLFVSRNKNK